MGISETPTRLQKLINEELIKYTREWRVTANECEKVRAIVVCNKDTVKIW